ncbi:MAG: hypothetical protein PHO08_11870 [Methylococcales bacterium]|nr:hypothetical protein [Methylococcales bacterium]MDD5632432.1 hypothetical protein [Methylococcales bacterium]
MEKFKTKYRVKTARLQSWNYGWNTAYFVTICINDKACHFGDVQDGEMKLSALGLWAEKCWLEIPDLFPFVLLDSFVVMPNHVHGIIIIDKPVETQNVELWWLSMKRIAPNTAFKPKPLMKNQPAAM